VEHFLSLLGENARKNAFLQPRAEDNNVVLFVLDQTERRSKQSKILQIFHVD